MPTRDKRFIWVDTYARWRITDPLLFFQRLRDERGAQSRLDDILDGETRNAVARHDLIELVRSTNRDPDDVPIESEEEAVILEEIERGRQEITGDILATAAERTADLGIELLDLRLKRIAYVEEVQKDVFARMIAERQRIAEQFRSEGQGESARIHGERERELAQIQSAAYRQAEELRGEAGRRGDPNLCRRLQPRLRLLRVHEVARDLRADDGSRDVLHSGDRQRAAPLP